MPLREMMADCPAPAEICNWIPVVGTLLGATIGFAGGLLNSWLTHRNREAREKGDRERDRLESLYKTLIEVRIYYQGMLGDMISKVHYDKESTVRDESSGIPPLVKLDMLMHLYFPNLADAHGKFVAVKERFGEKLAENLLVSFSDKPLEEKQRICGEYATLFKELDCEISSLQRKLASMARA